MGGADPRCREQNRDISEKIALGLAKPSASKEALVDSRVFNREALNTGFAGEDTYNLYDKPLFHGSSAAAAIYKPRGNDASANDESFGGGTAEGIQTELAKDRFQLGAGRFEGADANEVRDGPVQFEKDVVVSLDGTADPFGVEQFMDAARKGGKRSAEQARYVAAFSPLLPLHGVHICRGRDGADGCTGKKQGSASETTTSSSTLGRICSLIFVCTMYGWSMQAL